MLGVAGAAILGCGSWQREGAASGPTPESSLLELLNPAGVYQQLGRLVSNSGVGFIGTVAYLPGPANTTRMLIGLSAANRAFSFTRSGDRYEAGYRVEYTLTRNGAAPLSAGRDATIQVSALDEALRADESVILQQAFAIAPGDYQLTVRITDKGSQRSGVVVQSVTVPSFPDGSITAPILVYSVSPRQARTDSARVVLNPRGTAAYGGDTLLVYVEGVGMSAPRDVPLLVRDGRDSLVFQQTVHFDGTGGVESRVVAISPQTAPLGRLDLMLGETGQIGHATGLVSFSGGWVVTNFDDMLSLLRYFGEGNRLNQMRDASPAERPGLWQEFFHVTDPDRTTPENEALDAYFARLGQANQLYRDEGIAGWRTDRGEVYITLGPPDEIYDATPTQQGRYVRWGYTQWRLDLLFQDVSGFGRYRMTNDSRAAFDRVRSRIQRPAQ